MTASVVCVTVCPGQECVSLLKKIWHTAAKSKHGFTIAMVRLHSS